MAKIEFIGNLGADAKVQSENGRQFVTFNVADSESYTDKDGNRQERTNWISCTMSGDGGKLLPYLLKGKTVFCRGYMSTRLFNSAKHHMLMAGVNCRVVEIELVGGQTRPIPRRLNDINGRLFDVYDAYYVDMHIDSSLTELYDTEGRPYCVNKDGFVSIVNTGENNNTVKVENDGKVF